MTRLIVLTMTLAWAVISEPVVASPFDGVGENTKSDLQQRAIESITRQGLEYPAESASHQIGQLDAGEGDLQYRLAATIAGRNAVYPTVVLTRPEKIDMQTAISESIAHRYIGARGPD